MWKGSQSYCRGCCDGGSECGRRIAAQNGGFGSYNHKSWTYQNWSPPEQREIPNLLESHAFASGKVLAPIQLKSAGSSMHPKMFHLSKDVVPNPRVKPTPQNLIPNPRINPNPENIILNPKNPQNFTTTTTTIVPTTTTTTTTTSLPDKFLAKLISFLSKNLKTTAAPTPVVKAHIPFDLAKILGTGEKFVPVKKFVTPPKPVRNSAGYFRDILSKINQTEIAVDKGKAFKTSRFPKFTRKNRPSLSLGELFRARKMDLKKSKENFKIISKNGVQMTTKVKCKITKMFNNIFKVI